MVLVTTGLTLACVGVVELMIVASVAVIEIVLELQGTVLTAEAEDVVVNGGGPVVEPPLLLDMFLYRNPNI